MQETGGPSDFRNIVNCTPINNTLNTIVTKGQKSSRQLQFDCDDHHELTRSSAEKKMKASHHRNLTDFKTPKEHNTSLNGTLDDLQDLVIDFT